MTAPVTLERQGSLAVLTIDAPPLNLFDRAMFDALRSAVDELTEPGPHPPRGLLIRAHGRTVSGGVDVHEFEGLTAQAGRGAVERPHPDLPGRRGPAGPDRVRRPRAVPDRGVRARARLRPAARRRVGALRPRRDRRRTDAVAGRRAAPGRAGRAGARPRARVHRRAVRRRDARTLERRQPRVERRRASPTRRSPSRPGWPTGRRAPTPRPRRSSASSSAPAPARPTRSSPMCPARCSRPTICGERCNRS